MSRSDAGHAARTFAANTGPAEGLVLGLGTLLVLASLATAGVALWLFWVTSTVLPARDPAHVPMWRGVAVAFLAFSALSLGRVAGRPGQAPLRWALGVASAVALGLGGYGVLDSVRRASAGRDFEGYLLLLGLVLAGHGLLGLLHALLIARARALPLR